MSNKQMVSAPATTPEGMVRSINALLALDARGSLVPHGAGGLARDLLTKCAVVLSRPVEQNQGEPVAFVRFRNGEPDYDGDACMIMNVPGDTLGDGDSWEPVYTHVRPAEIERLRDENRRLHEAGEFLDGVNQGIEDKLRAQLAERDALLLEVKTDYVTGPRVGHKWFERRNTLLSASAEPSAPVETMYPKCTMLNDENVRYSNKSQGYVDPNRVSQGGLPSAPVELDVTDLIAEHRISIHFDEQKPNLNQPFVMRWVNCIAEGCDEGSCEPLGSDPKRALMLAISRAALERKP